MHTASPQLEAIARLPDALVRLGTPCCGAWTDPLAILVLLVSYMPLAHAAPAKISQTAGAKACTDVERWDSKLQ